MRGKEERVKRVKGEEGKGDRALRLIPLFPFPPFSLLTLSSLVVACLLSPFAAHAQKRPKPALKQGDARKAIAATQGFNLRTGAVKIVEIGPAGSSPVSVTAEVTEAVRIVLVEDERVPQTGGFFKTKRWRAVEFRTGDRAWEEFESLAVAAGAERVEDARRAIE